jgi:hypothetical protein
MTTPTESPEQPKVPVSFTATLDQPIKREGGDILKLTVRKPIAGELRGLKIGDLMNGDVSSVLTVLPRIASPFIAQHEADALSSEDLTAIADEMVGFFLTKAKKELIRRANGG